MERFFENALSIYIEGRFYRTSWCIISRVIEMSDKKTKMECRLTARGTNKANTKAVDDLVVPDPEPAVGERIIREAMEEETEDDNQ